MSVIVRALFPPALYEAGRREAVEMMIELLTEVMLSLRAEETPLDPITRQAAIDDLTRQLVALEAYRAASDCPGRQPAARYLE